MISPAFDGFTVLSALPCQTDNFGQMRSEEHTSELLSQSNLVCRLLLEKKKKNNTIILSVKTKTPPTPSKRRLYTIKPPSIQNPIIPTTACSQPSVYRYTQYSQSHTTCN